MSTEKIPERFEAFAAQDDYDRVIELATQFFQRHGEIDAVKDGVVYGKLHGTDLSNFALDSILRYCMAEPDTSRWPFLIERHFSIMLKLPKEAERKPFSSEEVRSLVTVRIYPESYTDHLELDQMVYRTDLEGTKSMLVLDYPDHFQMLLRQDLEGTRVSFEAAFAMGLQNLKKQPLHYSCETIAPGMQVFVINTKEYAASMVLCLEELSPSFVGPHGSIVAIPAKDTAFVYPLETQNYTPFIQAVDPVVQRLFAASPGPITPNYYQYMRGVFRKLN